MTAPGEVFVGREEVLEALRTALERAERGLGGMVLLRGEAGIGKSRIAEELVRHAEARGVQSLWGRAWEAGGAPAYWPLVEALRGLWRRREPGGPLPQYRSVLGELMPELRDGEAGARLPAAQARFMLLDALTCSLCHAAHEAPLCLVLDDMHAADADTHHALELLAVQARTSKLLVVATARPVHTPEAAHWLGRLGRVSTTLELPRLSHDDVAAFLRAALGEAPNDETLDSLFRTSEGNPLFLVELLHMVTRTQRSSFVVRALPQGVRAIVEQRLSQLSPATLSLLEAAAVLGREPDEHLLLSLCELPDAARTRALDEALEHAVLEYSSFGLRFSHVLLRDALYARIEAARRSRLHVAAAEALARAPEPAKVARAAHLVSAGVAHRPEAIEALAEAAREARARHAFDQAVAHFEQALSLADESFPGYVELLLETARAYADAGHGARHAALARKAAAWARQASDGIALGRAALELGRTFVFAAVDPDLVGLLEEAIAAVGERDPALRCRLVARHAAAEQPAARPDEPIVRARQAVEDARALKRPDVLRETLRSATSAMADLGDPVERAALNEEYVALSRAAGEPLEMLRGLTRLTLDRYELGEVERAQTALAQVETLASKLDLPHLRWQALGLFAMRALHEGRFSEAEALAEQARALGERASDPNAARAISMQRVARLRMQGRPHEALSALREARAHFRAVRYAEPWLDLMEACVRSQAGIDRTPLAPGLARTILALGDQSMLTLASEHALRSGDRPLAAELARSFAARSGRFVTWGALGLYIDLPIDRCLALCAATEDKLDEAVRWMEVALAQTEATRARPHGVWVAQELAHLLVSRGHASDVPRIAQLRARAARDAEALGIVLDTPRASPPRVQPLALDRHGEHFVLRWDGPQLHLEDTKGMRFLSQLLAEPRRSFHVLELCGLDPNEADRGHAGPLLDAEAIAAYRARVLTLRAALDERGHDDRARAELEALEDQLAAALGLGGRTRRSGSHVERARINVQRRLRDALTRIGQHAPELARELGRSLRTGVFCVYDP